MYAIAWAKDEGIFISTGLAHFTTSGSVIRVKNNKVGVIFASPFSEVHRKDSSFEGEYIGPISFNTADYCLGRFFEINIA